MKNSYTGSEQAAMWIEAIKEIRDACDHDREIIDEIVCRTRAKIEEGVPVKCKHCSDTGYEDVRGHIPCRNKC